MILKYYLNIGIFLLGGMFTGCGTIQPFKEIRHIGYDEVPTRGKSLGRVEGSDCSYKFFGHWFGYPSLDRALDNASSGRSSSITESVGGRSGIQGKGVKYLNNVRYEQSFFDIWFFGQDCLIVKGKGYI
jgi:hypothetical protein